MLEGPDVTVDEHLLRLVRIDAVEGLARSRQPHDEHSTDDELTAETEGDLPEVDLSLLSGGMGLRDVHLRDRDRPIALGLRDVSTHRRLADVGTELFDETLEDSPGGVALLSRSELVLREPPVDV